MKFKIFENSEVLISKVRRFFSAPRAKKVLFDHLPKCGGTSLRSYLRIQYPQNRIFSIDASNPKSSVLQFQSLTEKERFAYDLIEGHCANDLLDYVSPDCLKITIFRDPVERIISHYYYVKRNQRHYLHAKIISSNMSLEEYATSGLSIELNNWYTTHFSSITDAEIEHYPEKALTMALEVLLSKYDIIGFLDDYSTFIKQVKREANFWYEDDGAKRNVTNDRPSMEEVSESVKQVIAEQNYLDVKFYALLKERLHLTHVVHIS